MNKRFVSLMFVCLAVALTATPMMAACRAESTLPIGSILDITNTRVLRTAANIAVIIFAVNKPAQGFSCNSSVITLPPGCTTDGFSPLSAFSTNVASATQDPSDCKIYSVVSAAPGAVSAGFRIRFEENRVKPSRRTFTVNFSLVGAAPRFPTAIPFTIRAVPDPVE
jgi:hypothetical protein